MPPEADGRKRFMARADAVTPCPLPGDALLARYVGNAYTDCFFVSAPGAVTHAQFVEVFYTTWVFKLERLILRAAASRPSTDAEVCAIANGAADRFAAWRVEDRAEDQILLCDLSGRTRSWLMTRTAGDGRTHLYFGSAVVPVTDPATGRRGLGVAFRALLGFHRIYSRVLLHAARSGLS